MVAPNSVLHGGKGLGNETTSDNRRHPRISIQNRKLVEVELDGKPHSLIVADISQGGFGFEVPYGPTVNTDDFLAIGIEQVINLRGRVRWVSPAGGGAKEARLGLEFETLTVQPKSSEDLQDMVDAWMNISHSYNIFDGFLRIIESIDNDILDGNIGEFSDAVVGIAMWIEQQVGPVNIWQVITTGTGQADAILLVESTNATNDSTKEAASRAASVGSSQLTQWFDGKPFIYSENVVIECLTEIGTNTDLLHRLAHILGKRLRLWTKLLSRNIALQILGEEIERYRDALGKS